MNKVFEELCNKHELSDEAREDFKNLFEQKIVEVFYAFSKTEQIVEKVSKKVSKKVLGKETKETKEKETKEVESEDEQLCEGHKADGNKCTFKAKENGFCGRHAPDKKKAVKQPIVKKSKDTHVCHAITKEGNKCQQKGTTKPEFAVFHYCRRHLDMGWEQYEKELDDGQIPSDSDAD